MMTTALSPQRTTLVFVALWLLTSLLVGLLPTRHLTADAANNLLYVTNDNRFELWHGQHLLALWPGYAVAQLTGSAYTGIRLAHAVLAGATVACLFLALLRLVDSWRIAVPGALALLFSYGFWHYASDPDIYMAGYAAVALLLLALVHALRRPTTGRILALGLAASLAILCHQMNIEIAGLIGLALIGLALRPGSIHVRWAHVLLYAAASLGPTLLLYLVGWRDTTAWLVSQGQPAPGFVDWALRYFGAASSGEATWGLTLRSSTLPVAGYAVIQSWILPPASLDAGAWLALGLLGIGTIIVGVSGFTLVRRFSPVERIVALICLISLLANGISGWWWQAGNIKFYLFMQLYMLVLAALVARLAGRVARAGLWAAGLGLMLALLLFALPHETQGGVFRLVDLYGDNTYANLHIEDPTQERVLDYVSERSARLLLDEDCDGAGSYENRPGELRIWVMSAESAATCHLDGATLVDSYMADRARTVWQVWDVTAMTTSGE